MKKNDSISCWLVAITSLPFSLIAFNSVLPVAAFASWLWSVLHVSLLGAACGCGARMVSCRQVCGLLNGAGGKSSVSRWRTRRGQKWLCQGIYGR